MNDITVRPAKASDAFELAKLLASLGYPQDESFVLAKLAGFEQSSTAAVLIAEFKGSIAGFLVFESQLLFHEEGRIGTILALSVAENAQGKGVGSSLVSHAEEIARSVGCVKVSVASGLRREQAHAFYLSRGYEEITKRFVKRL